MKLTLEQQYVLSVLHCQYHACWCSGDFGASASAGMVLTSQSRNIKSPASKELSLSVKSDLSSTFYMLQCYRQYHVIMECIVSWYSCIIHAAYHINWQNFKDFIFAKLTCEFCGCFLIDCMLSMLSRIAFYLILLEFPNLWKSCLEKVSHFI